MAPSYAADVSTSARVESYVDRLRSMGVRLTTPRRAVLTGIVELGSHITAEELAAHVQARHPDVHESTVYRTLEMLARTDIVDHVHLAHGPATFHLADEQHQHLVCDACGTVVEVQDELFDDLAERVDREFGFALRSRHFALGGLCQRCRSAH